MHLLKQYLCSFAADGIAGPAFLETDDNPDVTCFEFVDFLRPVCMHPQNPVDPFTLFLADVHQCSAFAYGPVVYAHKIHCTGLTVDLDFKNQGQRRLVLGVGNLDLFLCFQMDAHDRRDFGGRRQIVDDSVKQGLHADVLQR